MVKQPNYISILTLVWLPWKQKEEKKKKREGAWVITGRIFITPNNLVYSVILKKKKSCDCRTYQLPLLSRYMFSTIGKFEVRRALKLRSWKANKGLSPGVTTVCFLGGLPVWSFRNWQTNLTGMEGVVSSSSVLSFLRTFITIFHVKRAACQKKIKSKINILFLVCWSCTCLFLYTHVIKALWKWSQ